MGMLGEVIGVGRALSKKAKHTPEQELAATNRVKERVMTEEMEINPALARQVNDGDITLAEAQRISANQNRRLGVGKEQAAMDDLAVISSVRGADPDGIKLFEWKQGLPQKQKAAVTSAEIEYKKGNPKPLAQLYRVMGVTAVVGAGSAGAEAGPLKTAATAATAASAGFASEDADAAALKLLGKLGPETATSQIKNRLNKDRFRGVSPGKSVTDYVHNNTNYDRGFLSDIRKSGEPRGGPTYTSGVTDFAKDLINSTDDPNVKSAIMEWVQPRIARGGQTAAVTAAAAGANRAAAEDEAPKKQGPVAKILTQMEELDLIPDAETRTIAMTFLKRELAAALEAIQMPAQGLWGTGRGMLGLATGEAPADTRRAMREVYTQPTDESLERAGQYVLKETGSPAAAAATSTLGMLTDPSFWL